MVVRRIGVLALTALASGGLASARSESLALQPSLAPAPQRPALPRVAIVPKPKPPLKIRLPQEAHRTRPADPLRRFCLDARRLRAAHEARRPAVGSPASVYIPFLAEGARLEAALAERLGKLPRFEGRLARFHSLASRRVTLSRALVRAAERRDPGAYSRTLAALAANALAARAASRAPGTSGCAG